MKPYKKYRKLYHILNQNVFDETKSLPGSLFPCPCVSGPDGLDVPSSPPELGEPPDTGGTPDPNSIPASGGAPNPGGTPDPSKPSGPGGIPDPSSIPGSGGAPNPGGTPDPGGPTISVPGGNSDPGKTPDPGGGPPNPGGLEGPVGFPDKMIFDNNWFAYIRKPKQRTDIRLAFFEPK